MAVGSEAPRRRNEHGFGGEADGAISTTPKGVRKTWQR